MSALEVVQRHNACVTSVRAPLCACVPSSPPLAPSTSWSPSSPSSAAVLATASGVDKDNDTPVPRVLSTAVQHRECRVLVDLADTIIGLPSTSLEHTKAVVALAALQDIHGRVAAKVFDHLVARVKRVAVDATDVFALGAAIRLAAASRCVSSGYDAGAAKPKVPAGAMFAAVAAGLITAATKALLSDIGAAAAVGRLVDQQMGAAWKKVTLKVTLPQLPHIPHVSSRLPAVGKSVAAFAGGVASKAVRGVIDSSGQLVKRKAEGKVSAKSASPLGASSQGGGGGASGGGNGDHGGNNVVTVAITAVVHVMDKLSSGEHFGYQLAVSENQCRLVLALCRLLVALVDLASDVLQPLKEDLRVKLDALSTKVSRSPSVFMQNMVRTVCG